MTVRGWGQSQNPITPPRPKPAEKKAVIYFAVTRTKLYHVAHSGGTLIMLSEEDVRMLSPSAMTARHAALSQRELAGHRPLKSSAHCLFLTNPWEEGNGRARGVESLSEKKANLECRDARLKHSQCEHSAPLSTASAWDFPKHVTSGGQ